MQSADTFSFELQKPKWYALFVRSNQEKRVARHLEHRGVEHLLPSYQCTSRRKDRHVDLERALFPGYLFIKLPFCERLKVLTVPNVLSIVGTRTCPSVVSDDEISWIKSGVEHGGLKPHSYLEVGTRVVVMSGVAAGMEGILLRKHNNVRILVALDSIAQAFVIEIDGALVKPVGGKLACAASASQIQEHQGDA